MRGGHSCALTTRHLARVKYHESLCIQSVILLFTLWIRKLRLDGTGGKGWIVLPSISDLLPNWISVAFKWHSAIMRWSLLEMISSNIPCFDYFNSYCSLDGVWDSLKQENRRVRSDGGSSYKPVRQIQMTTAKEHPCCLVTVWSSMGIYAVTCPNFHFFF